MPRRLISIQHLMRLVFVVAAILALLLKTGDTRVLFGAFAVAVMALDRDAIFQRETHWVDAAAIYEPFKLDDPALPPVVVDYCNIQSQHSARLAFELRGRFRLHQSGPATVTGHIALRASHDVRAGASHRIGSTNDGEPDARVSH